MSFLGWVDSRFLGRAVVNEKHRQRKPNADNTFNLLPQVRSISYDDPALVMTKPGTSRFAGQAAEHPDIKAWIAESTPRYVEETFDPKSGEVMGGGVSTPKDFNQVDSYNLDVGL